MTINKIKTTIRNHESILHQKFAVKKLSIFGSTVRGEETPESDLDILVEFNDKPNFDLYMGLKFYLEDLLNIKVDLVTNNALRPKIRPQIEQEAIRVA